MIVTALHSFDHDQRAYRRGDQLNVTSFTARDLRDRGLVSFNGLPDEHPQVADGDPLSASLPAQAAPQTTSSESDSGDSPKPKAKRKSKARPDEQ